MCQMYHKYRRKKERKKKKKEKKDDLPVNKILHDTW